MNAIVPIHAAPVVPFADIERMAVAVAQSGLFGIKTKEQALALMCIAQAEGRHPALAARDYDIIQNRPAKKAEAMLRDFLEAGGKVQWVKLTDTEAEATFSHPAGGTATISWDMQRAQKAGIGGKDNWKKFPRQMLRSRVVSEGVRTIYPMATSGMYVPEEVADFEPRPMRDVTPPKGSQSNGEVQPDNVLAALRSQGDVAADQGVDVFTKWWNSREIKPRRDDLRQFLDAWKALATKADQAAQVDDGRNWTTWGREIVEQIRVADAETLPDLSAEIADVEGKCPEAVIVDINLAYQARRSELDAQEGRG